MAKKYFTFDMYYYDGYWRVDLDDDRDSLTLGYAKTKEAAKKKALKRLDALMGHYKEDIENLKEL